MKVVIVLLAITAVTVATSKDILRLRAKHRTLADDKDSGFMLNFGDSQPSAEHSVKSVNTVHKDVLGQENGQEKSSNDAADKDGHSAGDNFKKIFTH